MISQSSSNFGKARMRDALSGDIAVIGMSCRFPGARDADQYWENLVAGCVSVGEAPAARWRWQDCGAGSTEDASYCRWGGFIDDIDAFDASFFNVSAREAESMDPQQRLGLELAWACFEDAGLRPSQLSGGHVGVFLGCTNLDYKEIMELSPINLYYATGTLSSVIPSRISYQFNLRGPSVAIDTACSSSLQAMHMACRALEKNECEMALAGGISLLLTPKRFIWYGKAGILSPTGTLRTFDENANGTVRGEGAGFLLLKPLARAMADGNRILGVIQGSAVNHGGKNYTLTYPSVDAQAEVIANALHAAGVEPSEVSYVEAHGTGTVKGDPIEVQGLVKAFAGAGAPGRNGRGPWCGLGSVKANIGHLEGAAGAAGVIKMLLALRHKTLPPLVHFTKANSRIDLGGPFYFVDKLQAWNPEGPRVAGVSSFGFAGTNAHLVLAEAPNMEQEVAAESEGASLRGVPPRISAAVLSARTPERLKEQARQLRQGIVRQGLNDGDLERMSFTLQAGRDEMPHRMAVTVRSMKELEWKLDQFIEGRSGVEGLHLGEAKKGNETPALETDKPSQREAAGPPMEEAEWTKLLALWVEGRPLPWEQLYGERKPQFISLPTYPFARERYWAEAKTLSSGAGAGLHPLLHQNTSDLDGQRFSSVFNGREFFLADHRIQGRRVLPAAAYLEMAREAVVRSLGDGSGHGSPEAHPVRIKNLVLLRPLVVDQQPVEAHIALCPENGNEIGFEVYSGSGSAEQVHAQGVAIPGAPREAPRLDVEALAKRYQQGSYSSQDCYAVFAELGMDYGEAHRGIEGLHVEENEVVARLSLPIAKPASRFVLHPGVLDSGLQAMIGFVLASAPTNGGRSTFLPFEFRNVEIYGACTPKMWALVRRYAAAGAESAYSYDVDLCDETGLVCLRLQGLSTRTLEARQKELSKGAAEIQHQALSESAERSLEPATRIDAEKKTSRRRKARFSSMPEVGASRKESTGSLTIVGMNNMWAQVRREKEAYDIDVCDEYGRVRAQLRDWTERPVQNELQSVLSVEASAAGEVILTPSWEPVPGGDNTPRQAVAAGCVAVIGGTRDQHSAIRQVYAQAKFLDVTQHDTLDSIAAKLRGSGEVTHLVWLVPQHVSENLASDSVIDGQSQGVHLGFRLIKALLASGYGEKTLTWTVLTAGVEAVLPDERTNPTHASVHGLMGSVANEYAGWTIRLLDLPASGKWPWQEVFAVEQALRGNALVYREGRWYGQQLLPYRVLHEPPAMESPGEVYVIIGGHGGIGAAWSEMLLRRSSVQLIWIGRRPLDRALQSRLDGLAELGPAPLYISADATDRQQLEQARSIILQKFGRIDGVVHAAMVLHDQTLVNMTEDGFQSALRPKIDGTVRLAQVFGQDALRFVLFFSSYNSFIKSAGQSNYVAGCTFKDSFARRMAAEWPCRVRVMNWGYWGTVGAATSERYHSLMARKGLGSIELPGATRILDELLRGRVGQMVYLVTNERNPLQTFNLRSDQWTTSLQETLPSCRPAMERAGKAMDEMQWSPSPNWRVMGEELDAMAVALLWSQLQSMGFFGERGACCETAQLSEKVHARFIPWLTQSLRILEASGHLAVRGQQLNVLGPGQAESKAAWDRWGTRKSQWLGSTEWASGVQLVEAALRALPDILAGRQAAAEILFADFFAPASMPLIAKAMRSGPVVRFCNQAIARMVVQYIEERRRQDPHCELRILEIGTGTGSTTEAMLEAIAPHSKWVKEYACTGASMPLLSAARKWLNSDRPYVVYRAFDVEKAPEAQGIALDCYDLAIASNVLYAARNIREALRNVKAVLKTNGVFMLHELSRNHTLYHLTVGLLDTWWAFADTELRVAGGPVLRPETWKAVLQQEGFRSVLFPAQRAHDHGQQVVMAESDGVVRQCLVQPTFLQGHTAQPESEPEEIPEARVAEAARPVTLDEIMGSSRDVAMEYLFSRVRVRAAEALGIDPTMRELQSSSFADMMLAEIGMDSLSSNDLRNALRQDLGVDIPVQRIIGEKVQRIVDSLYDELLIRRISSAPVAETSDDRETYVF